MTKPRVRYDLQDGAIFSFVLTTDPQVLHLIEARPRDGVLAWHDALARMSIVNLRAQHNEQRVWQVDQANKGGPPDSPYITRVVSDRPLGENVQP